MFRDIITSNRSRFSFFMYKNFKRNATYIQPLHNNSHVCDGCYNNMGWMHKPLCNLRKILCHWTYLFIKFYVSMHSKYLTTWKINFLTLICIHVKEKYSLPCFLKIWSLYFTIKHKIYVYDKVKYKSLSIISAEKRKIVTITSVMLETFQTNIHNVCT